MIALTPEPMKCHLKYRTGSWSKNWVAVILSKKGASDGKDTAKFGYIQMFRVKFDDRG
jgi:hypothetical protein